MKILGIIFIVLGLIIFGLLFFLLAPFICTLIPSGAWKAFFDFMVYIIIAWLGGIFIPIYLIVCGIQILIISN